MDVTYCGHIFPHQLSSVGMVTDEPILDFIETPFSGEYFDSSWQWWLSQWCMRCCLKNFLKNIEKKEKKRRRKNFGKSKFCVFLFFHASGSPGIPPSETDMAQEYFSCCGNLQLLSVAPNCTYCQGHCGFQSLIFLRLKIFCYSKK